MLSTSGKCPLFTEVRGTGVLGSSILGVFGSVRHSGSLQRPGVS
jgi:hypothetical protein